MAIGTTTDAFPVALYSARTQLDSSLGTGVSTVRFPGTTNGRRFFNLRITSNAAGGPAPGSKLLILFYDGSTEGIIETINLPGGALSQQGRIDLGSFPVVGTANGFKFQLTTALPSGVTPDIIATGVDF